MTKTQISFAGLAPSPIHACVAEAIQYAEEGGDFAPLMDAIEAGLQIEFGNSGPVDFFLSVAARLQRKPGSFGPGDALSARCSDRIKPELSEIGDGDMPRINLAKD